MRLACHAVIAAAAAMASAGCAVYPGTARPADLEDLRREEGWLLVADVPEIRQVSEKGCGAACLAMVLGHWGVATPVEEIERECSGGDEAGLRATALRDAATRRGLSAYLFAGTVADIEHELERGRPVVVGLAKPHGEGTTAHFEVVIGLHSGGARIAALDPGIGLTSDTLAGFEAEWRVTRGVMIVVFRPEALGDPADRVASHGGER